MQISKDKTFVDWRAKNFLRVHESKKNDFFAKCENFREDEISITLFTRNKFLTKGPRKRFRNKAFFVKRFRVHVFCCFRPLFVVIFPFAFHPRKSQFSIPFSRKWDGEWILITRKGPIFRIIKVHFKLRK